MINFNSWEIKEDEGGLGKLLKGIKEEMEASELRSRKWGTQRSFSCWATGYDYLKTI